MIVLKAIHPSFTLTNNTRFPSNSHTRPSSSSSSTLCLCKPNDSDSDQPPKPEGDSQSQELLAQIAMLQAQKVRLTDFLDERSSYLSQFGEEAKAEFDKIGEDALKGLDEADARITANIESQMLAFEESNELSKQEIQESENKLLEFEDQLVKDQNEGLFFKSLGQQKKNEPVVIAEAKDEVEKIENVSREIGGSKTRKNIYLFFIGLVTFGIVNSLNSSSTTDWRKVVVLGAILVALFSQFIYEQNKDNKKDQ